MELSRALPLRCRRHQIARQHQLERRRLFVAHNSALETRP